MNPTLEQAISEHPYTQIIQSAFKELPNNTLRAMALLRVSNITNNDVLLGAVIVFWCLDKQERDAKLQAEQQVLAD